MTVLPNHRHQRVSVTSVFKFSTKDSDTVLLYKQWNNTFIKMTQKCVMELSLQIIHAGDREASWIKLEAKENKE